MTPLIREFADALRAQREAQGLTLDEIFTRTRINPELLEAIETGHFDILPPTYVRLFLKTYAREIGLDVEEVIKHYETIAPKPAPAAPPPQAKRPISPVPLIVLSLIFIGAIGLVAWQINQYIPEDPALPLDMAAPPASFQVPDAPAEASEADADAEQPEAAPVAQPEHPSSPVQGPMPEPQPGPVPSVPAAQPQRPVPETTPSPESEPAAPAPAPHLAAVFQPDARVRPAAPPSLEAAQTSPPEPAESRALTTYDMPLPSGLSDLETLTLAGFVRENTRVLVYADGQTVFDGELRAGSRPSWQARESFRLYIVRAGAIALWLHNQAIAPPSPPDQSLRLLVNRTRIRVEELALPHAER